LLGRLVASLRSSFAKLAHLVAIYPKSVTAILFVTKMQCSVDIIAQEIRSWKESICVTVFDILVELNVAAIIVITREVLPGEK
jgi:hypothetical protein